MAKKSKKQQDEEQIPEIPEDRIEQIEEPKPEGQVDVESEGEGSEQDLAEQAQAPEEKRAKKDKPESTSSREDLLADVRQSLISDADTEEEQGFFSRVRKRFKKPPKPQAVEPQVVETPPAIEEGILETRVEEQEEPEEPEIPALKPKSKKKKSSKNRQEEIAIQEFFSDLEALAHADLDEDMTGGIEPPEPEPQVKAEPPAEKPQIPRLPVKSEEAKEVDFEKIRGVALEEYDGTAAEPEDERKVDLEKNVRRTIRELRPIERIALIVFGVLTVGLLLYSGVFLIVKTVTLPTPTPAATADLSNTIFPIQLSLPGGWNFDLGRGNVTNGEWVPQGPEWLVGTEISRWVALPWSLQLEAVLRTFKSGDQIELTMSNYDTLTYKVYSIQQLTLEEIHALNQKTPSLLIILYNNSDKTGAHWVVTALP